MGMLKEYLKKPELWKNINTTPELYCESFFKILDSAIYRGLTVEKLSEIFDIDPVDIEIYINKKK